MKHTIKVKQHHIDSGSAADLRFCPVALAVSEAMSIPLGFVSVDGCAIRVLQHKRGYGSVWCETDTPDETASFIDHFDGCGDISPFEFTLPPVVEWT